MDVEAYNMEKETGEQWTPPVTCPLEGIRKFRGLKVHPIRYLDRPQYFGHFLVLEGQFVGHCGFNFF